MVHRIRKHLSEKLPSQLSSMQSAWSGLPLYARLAGLVFLSLLLAAAFANFDIIAAVQSHRLAPGGWWVDAAMGFSLACVVGALLSLQRRGGSPARQEQRDSGVNRQNPPTAADKFYTLAKGSIEGVYVQRDFSILYANQALADIFGFSSPAEMIGRNVLELFHEEDREYIAGLYRTRIAWEPAPAKIESRGMHKDGTPVWLELLVRTVDWEGSAAVQVTLLDISVRRKAEEELQSSQRRLQTVFDVIPHLMAIKDEQGRYLAVNRAWREFYGLTPEGVLGKFPKEFSGRPEQETRLMADEDQIVLNGPEQVHIFEAERINCNGEPRMLQNIMARMEDEGGRLTGMVTVGLDITDRIVTEQKLRDSQRLMQTVFDVIPIVMAVKDTQGRYLSVNRAWQNLYGVAFEDAVDRHATEIATRPQGDTRITVVEDKAVLEGPEPVRIFETERTGQDGKSRTFQSIKARMEDELGKVTGLVSLGLDITDRLRAEKNLRDNERLLQTVFDTLPVGTYIKDRESRIVMANQAFASIYNKAPDDLKGMTTAELHQMDVYAARQSRSTDRRVLDSGRQAVIPEQRITKLDGEEYWRRAVKVPLKDERGQVTGLVCAQEDITEFKRAEQREQGRGMVLELLATGASLRQVLEQIIENTQSLFPEMLCSVLLVDQESRHIRVGAAPGLPEFFHNAIERIDLNHPPLVDPTAENTPPFTTDQLMAHPLWTKIAQAGKGAGLKACWCHPISSPDDENLGAFVVYFRAQREPSEQENEQSRIAVRLAGIALNRHRTERALRSSEERFRHLVDQAVDAFFILEPEGEIVDVNLQACESLGYTRRELLAMRIEDFECNPDFMRDLEAWREKGRLAPITLNGTHRRRDGSTFPIEVRLGIIRVGERRLVMAVARDQSERKWLEDQFTQAQKMRAIGGLAGGIAHEFNNILTPLIGYTNLAQNRLEEHEEAFKDLEIVKKAANRARELVSQILLFSRKRKGERRALQLDAVIKEVLMLLSSVLPKSIVIAQRIEPKLLRVSADPIQMHVLLMNLITNANQAMPDGGVLHLALENVTLKDFEVGPRQKVSGKHLHLMVKDTGVGMDAATLSRIFEPFFTSKELGLGTGMGLSSVYGIVRNHNGYIMVDSEKGAGTTFDVYLPAVELEPAQPQSAVQMDSGGRESILLVDDEEDITQLGKYGLERLGYNVLAVTSPQAALEAFRANPRGFDLIVTDQIMPQMNGDILVREIRSLRPDIPVIISTGFDTKFVEGDLKRLGVSHLLLKPFGYEELAQVIREAIDAHYLHDGRIESEGKAEHAMEAMAPFGLAGATPGKSGDMLWGKKFLGDNGARISVIESEEGIIIEIAGQHSLSEDEQQKLLSLYAQAKKNGKHTVVQCENRLYEFLKVTGFDKFLELSVLQ